MEIIKILWVYAVWFITLLILDYIWLWHITKDFLVREFWSLISTESDWSIKINLTAWLMAWLVISAMVVTFVTLKYNSIWDIVIYWALIWFMSYAMYDLTNLTFLNNYSIKFTIVDILWWTFACTMVSISSFYFYNLIK